MTSFLGMEVKQEDGCIKSQLDTYVQEMLDEYKNRIKLDLKPKQTPMQRGDVLTNLKDAMMTQAAQKLRIQKNRLGNSTGRCHWSAT